MEEIFNRFAQRADKINNTWDIVEFFESELEKFKEEVETYKNNIAKEQETLKAIRSEYAELQSCSKELKEEIEVLNRQKDDLTPQFEGIEDIEKLRESYPIRPLEKVEIKLPSDGYVVQADPANEVYPKEVVDKYLLILRELKALKSKLMEVEFENAKLRHAQKDLENSESK